MSSTANTPTHVTHELLMRVTEIARAAGRAIMAVYETDFAVDTKADDSPLTAADRAAHGVISEQLAALTPRIPVLSEESAPPVHEFTHRSAWPELWLVDPLDGTREFIKRNGEFTVNIAMIEAHAPVLGVVYAPVPDIMYFGARGIGAWSQAGSGSASPLQVQRPVRSTPVVVGSRSHRDASLDAVLERLGSHELRSIGSSLKFCLVADGTADFYPRFGPTSEWDTAAGHAVLESAGGQVTDFTGVPLRYNARSTVINPGFIAFADPARDWRGLMGG